MDESCLSLLGWLCVREVGGFLKSNVFHLCYECVLHVKTCLTPFQIDNTNVGLMHGCRKPQLR